MDPKDIIVIEELAVVSITNAIKLYNKLRDNNPALRPVEEILTEANATADKVIAEADKQIAEAQASGAGFGGGAGDPA